MPPDFIKEKAFSMLGSHCTSFQCTGEIPEDTEVLIGELTLLEKKSLPNLKLVIIPHAGVNLPLSTASVLSKEYPDLSILTLHHNAVATAETGIALLLAVTKQVGEKMCIVQKAKAVPLYVKTVNVDKELREGSWASSSMAHWLGRKEGPEV